MPFVPRACAEFPNDNPELHDGAVWICTWNRAHPRALVSAQGVARSSRPPEGEVVPGRTRSGAPTGSGVTRDPSTDLELGGIEALAAPAATVRAAPPTRDAFDSEDARNIALALDDVLGRDEPVVEEELSALLSSTEVPVVTAIVTTLPVVPETERTAGTPRTELRAAVPLTSMPPATVVLSPENLAGLLRADRDAGLALSQDAPPALELEQPAAEQPAQDEPPTFDLVASAEPAQDEPPTFDLVASAEPAQDEPPTFDLVASAEPAPARFDESNVDRAALEHALADIDDAFDPLADPSEVTVTRPEALAVTALGEPSPSGMTDALSALDELFDERGFEWSTPREAVRIRPASGAFRVPRPPTAEAPPATRATRPAAPSEPIEPLALELTPPPPGTSGWQTLSDFVAGFLMTRSATRAAAVLRPLLEGRRVPLDRLPAEVKEALEAASIAKTERDGTWPSAEFRQVAAGFHLDFMGGRLEDDALLAWISGVVRALLANAISHAATRAYLERAGIDRLLKNAA